LGCLLDLDRIGSRGGGVGWGGFAARTEGGDGLRDLATCKNVLIQLQVQTEYVQH